MLTYRRRFWSRVGALLLGVGGAAGGGYLAWCQDTVAPDRPQITRSFYNKARFQLPLHMEDRVKSQLKEIHLYTKEVSGDTWHLLDKATPFQAGFTIQMEKEGEYLFSMVMVDRSGRMIPGDINQLVPSLAVVVDLKAPQVEVQALGMTSEGQTFQVDVRDPNADLSKTQVSYQSRDQVWRSLDPMNQHGNRYSIPAQAAITGMVRIIAADMAGNITRQDFNLSSLPSALSASEPLLPGVTIPVQGAPERPTFGSQPTREPAEIVPMPPEIPTPVSRGTSTSNKVTVVKGSGPIEVKEHVEIIDSKPGSIPPPFPQSSTTIVETKPATVGQEAHSKQGQVVNSYAARQEPPSANRRLINQTQLQLDYQLEQVGASGVGKVEVWLTRDQGKSWQKLGEDPDCKSPVAVELPGEGVFGISLAVSNGRGFGGNPPSPGDTPETCVEVDTTKPAIELTSVRPGNGEEAGSVVIHWTAQDRNLAADGIDLYYATTRDGTWQTVAKGIKNDGRCRWVPPPNLSQVFIRLVVHDQAGNSSTVETPQPLLLDDQSRPRGRLLGVNPIQPGAAVPKTDPRGN